MIQGFFIVENDLYAVSNIKKESWKKKLIVNYLHKVINIIKNFKIEIF